jgi:hypothetical protein
MMPTPFRPGHRERPPQRYRRINRRQNQSLALQLTRQILDYLQLRFKETLIVDRHFTPILRRLDIQTRNHHLILNFHDIHVGSTEEVDMILYRLAAQLMFKVKEESRRHIFIRFRLVEYWKDRLAFAVCSAFTTGKSINSYSKSISTNRYWCLESG